MSTVVRATIRSTSRAAPTTAPLRAARTTTAFLRKLRVQRQHRRRQRHRHADLYPLLHEQLRRGDLPGHRNDPAVGHDHDRCRAGRQSRLDRPHRRDGSGDARCRRHRRLRSGGDRQRRDPDDQQRLRRGRISALRPAARSPAPARWCSTAAPATTSSPAPRPPTPSMAAPATIRSTAAPATTSSGPGVGSKS